MSDQFLISHDDEIQSKVITLIAEQLHISEDSIELKSDMTTDLKIDSLDSVQISLALEEFFGIKIPEEKLNLKEEPLLVGEIVSVVICLVRNKPEQEKQSLFQRLTKLLGTNDE